jgi:hypothetical protein
MANWTSIIKATGTQPTVIGSVNSFWQTPSPSAQGDISALLPDVKDIATFYSDQLVTPLTVINSTNSSIFLGFPSNEDLFPSFQIYNDTTQLVQRGKMQGLVGRDESAPFNAQITIYAPHIDAAPAGHVGLIEAFSLNFENLDPGNPWSSEAQEALTQLGSRIWKYTPVLGPSWDTAGQSVGNFFLDQVNGWFAKGGAMSYADASTSNLPKMCIPS